MDIPTLIAQLDFSRQRLLALLDTIEKGAPNLHEALAWRPAPGRAHIAWQAMHCAATHDRYLNARLKGGQPKLPQIVESFAGGSTPSDTNVPTLGAIRDALNSTYTDFRAYIQGLTLADLQRKMMFGTTERSIGETITLLAWHEAHHQGQIHLTWNCYKATHNLP